MVGVSKVLINIKNKRSSFELSVQRTLKIKTLSSTTIFIIDNNKKCFLSTKSAL